MAEKTVEGKRAPERERKPGIPPKVIAGLRERLSKLAKRFRLALEEDNSRCSLVEGDNVIAGPFTHGQSVQAWVDGYTMGHLHGEEAGKEKGVSVAKQDERVHVCIVKTGHTYHAFQRRRDEWHRIDSNKLPALSFGGAVEAAATTLQLSQFSVEYQENNASTS
jgi:hypothetical protein